MNIINTITHRGIVCIDTFPLELVWGKTNTILECSNCLEYATFKNVLVGLCKNCAVYSYNCKYGLGFYNFPYSDLSNNDISLCFGNINPINILNIKGIEYPQTALNYSDSYSIYNLSLSPKNELFLLIQEPFNIYGLHEFQKYYNCSIEVLDIIIHKIKEHKLSFNIWSNKYYSECLNIENFYKVSEEDYKIQSEIANNKLDKPKSKCSYCNIYKLKTELKKCGKCGISKYCSSACQIRDWKGIHELYCEQEQQKEKEQEQANSGNSARKTAFENSEGDDDDEDDDEDDEDNSKTDIYDNYEYESDYDYSIHHASESDIFGITSIREFD